MPTNAGFTPIAEITKKPSRIQLNFRLSAKQADDFRERAERARMSLTEYFLSRCLSDEGGGADPEAVDTLFETLAAIRAANAELVKMARSASALERDTKSVSSGVAAEALRKMQAETGPVVERAMLEAMGAIDRIRNSW